MIIFIHNFFNVHNIDEFFSKVFIYEIIIYYIALISEISYVLYLSPMLSQ